MSLVSVPTSTTELVYEQVTELDGREYVLRFTWADRDSSWYLSIYDQSDTPLALGLALVVGESLISHLTDPRLPPGTLVVVDLQGTDIDPGVVELGARCVLLYSEASS